MQEEDIGDYSHFVAHLNREPLHSDLSLYINQQSPRQKPKEKESFLVQESNISQLQDYTNSVLKNFGYPPITDFQDVEGILKSLIEVMRHQQKQLQNNSRLSEKVTALQFEVNQREQGIVNAKNQLNQQCRESKNRLMTMQKQVDQQLVQKEKQQKEMEALSKQMVGFKSKATQMTNELRRKDIEIQKLAQTGGGRKVAEPVREVRGDRDRQKRLQAENENIQLRNVMANQLARLQDLVRLGSLDPECTQQPFPVFLQYMMSSFERVAGTLQQSFLVHKEEEIEEIGELQNTMHPLQYKKEATFNIESSQFRMTDSSMILGSQSKNILEDMGDKEDLSKWEDYFSRLN